MTFKTALAALVLALAPAIASAECGWQKMNASSCGEGQVDDAASGTCVSQTTS